MSIRSSSNRHGVMPGGRVVVYSRFASSLAAGLLVMGVLAAGAAAQKYTCDFETVTGWPTGAVQFYTSGNHIVSQFTNNSMTMSTSGWGVYAQPNSTDIDDAVDHLYFGSQSLRSRKTASPSTFTITYNGTNTVNGVELYLGTKGFGSSYWTVEMYVGTDSTPT